MQNYRLRLLSEKLDLELEIKPLAEAAHEKAKQERDAARRQLKFRVNLERQAQETEDERKRKGCYDLLSTTAPLETLRQNLELARRKLSSTVRLVMRIQETEARYRAEVNLTDIVETEYSDALEAIRKKFGDIEVVYKLNEKKQELDIYFGGQDSPVGEGHAHWVYRRGTYVYRRDPKDERVAC